VLYISVHRALQADMNVFLYNRLRDNQDKDSYVLEFPPKLWSEFVAWEKSTGGLKFDVQLQYAEQYATADTTGIRRDVNLRNGNPPRTVQVMNGHQLIKHRQTQQQSDLATAAVSMSMW
jgi:hypothetical protein